MVQHADDLNRDEADELRRSFELAKHLGINLVKKAQGVVDAQAEVVEMSQPTGPEVIPPMSQPPQADPIFEMNAAVEADIAEECREAEDRDFLSRLDNILPSESEPWVTADAETGLTIQLMKEGMEIRISAREMCKQLGVRQEFFPWWRFRSSQLVEGEDHRIFVVDDENSKRERPRQDFLLTADAAKVVCMLDHNC